MTQQTLGLCRKELALLESASAAASDVTNAVMALKVELDEKKKSVELLQKALVSDRTRKSIFHNVDYRVLDPFISKITWHALIG